MLYNVIKKFRGKEEVVFTDQLAKAQNYKKRLSASQRKGVKNQRVEYTVVPADEGDNEKYKKAPHKIHLSGQPRRSGPRVVGK